MGKRHLLKNNILYRMYKDKWGREPRYYINFTTLTQYRHYEANHCALYVNDDGLLCNDKDEPLPEHIQLYYVKWLDSEVDRILTGNNDDT